jgi:hypothetical protein
MKPITLLSILLFACNQVEKPNEPVKSEVQFCEQEQKLFSSLAGLDFDKFIGHSIEYREKNKLAIYYSGPDLSYTLYYHIGREGEKLEFPKGTRSESLLEEVKRDSVSISHSVHQAVDVFLEYGITFTFWHELDEKLEITDSNNLTIFVSNRAEGDDEKVKWKLLCEDH